MGSLNRLLPKTLNRRQFLAGAAILAAASPQHGRAQEPGSLLRLLCWGGYDHAEATAAFRQETGVQVHATYIGANDEIFLKLRAGGIGRYDLVTPQNGVVRPLAEAGLIQPIDLGRLSNAVALLPTFRDPDWAVIDGQVYAVPYLWGAAPLVYNADVLARPPASWLDLQSQDYRGQIVMHDDGLGHLKIWNRVLGAEDPARVSPAELTQAADVLISIKSQQVIVFSPDMGALAGILAREEAALATLGWASVPRMEVAREANLQLAYPQPGTFSFCDNFCLAANAPNIDAAYAFIDAMLSAGAQASVTAAVGRGTVSAEAVPLLEPGIRELYPYDDLAPFFELNPFFGFPPVHDDGSGLATYVDWVNAWERVRYAQMEAG